MFWKKRRQVSKTAEQGPFLVAHLTKEAGMVVEIDPSQIESASIAGIILVDLMRHFARALTQSEKAKSEQEANDTMAKYLLGRAPKPHGSWHWNNHKKLGAERAY